MTFASTLSALNPLAWYRFDETSGTTLVDSSGHGHNGTYSSTGVTFGVTGLTDDTSAAVTFDGVSGLATIPYDASWMAFSVFSAVVVTKVAAGTFCDLTTSNGWLEIAVNSDGSVSGSIQTATGWVHAHSGAGAFTFDTPQTVAVTYDGTTVSVYVAGSLLVSAAQTGTPLNGSDFRVSSWTGTDFYPQTVGEVALFSRALNATEVGSLSGVTPPPPPPPPGSGYDYTAVSTVTYDVPVVPPPAGMLVTPVNRVHWSLPAPTIVDGRPIFGAKTETTGVWADHLRVKVGGADVTFFRGMRTIVSDWQQTDPYGWMQATFVLPSVTAFDDIEGDAAIKSWLYEGATVRFAPVLGGAVVNVNDPPFQGIVDRIAPGPSATIVTCSGWFNGRLSTRMHQPSIPAPVTQDAGAVIAGYLDHRTRFSVLPAGGPTTGIPLQLRGSRDMTWLGFLDEALGWMIRENGVSWTLLPDPSGIDYMRCSQRSMSGVDATVSYGAHGVTVDAARDRVDMINVVYGEGVAPNGERYRNAVYPRVVDAPAPPYPGDMSLGTTDAGTSTGSGVSVLSHRLWALGLLAIDENAASTFTADHQDAVEDFQARRGVAQTGAVTSSLWTQLFDNSNPGWGTSHFEPMSSDPRVEYWLLGPNGTPVDLNPVYDATVSRQEAFVSFGEGIWKRDARKYAKAMRERGGDLTGTIVLQSDPAEKSRFDLRPGDKIQVDYYRGAAGVKFYISSVQVDWANAKQPVTLAVSTTAKHYLELAQIRQRNLDARKDVGKQARHQFRRSTQVSDSGGGWEGESGAGVVEETALKGGQWNVLMVTAAQFGVMSNVVLTTTNSACAWWMSAHATQVEESVFNSVLGNPGTWRGTGTNQVDVWTDKLDWLRQPERLMIEGWGDPDNMPGYFPNQHTNSAGKVTTFPITGRFEDHGSWDFISETGFIWLAIYPTADCSIRGRFQVQLTGEGV